MRQILRKSNKRKNLSFGVEQVLFLTDKLPTQSINSVKNNPTIDLVVMDENDVNAKKDFWEVKNLINVVFKTDAKTSILDYSNYTQTKNQIEGYTATMDVQIHGSLDTNKIHDSFNQNFTKINSLNDGVYGFCLFTKYKAIKGLVRIVPLYDNFGDGNINIVNRDLITMYVLDFEVDNLTEIDKNLLMLNYPDSSLSKLWVNKTPEAENHVDVLEYHIQEIENNSALIKVVDNLLFNGVKTTIYKNDILKDYYHVVVRDATNGKALELIDFNGDYANNNLSPGLQGESRYWDFISRTYHLNEFKKDNEGFEDGDYFYYIMQNKVNNNEIDNNAIFVDCRDWVPHTTLLKKDFNITDYELQKYKEKIIKDSTVTKLVNYSCYDGKFKLNIYGAEEFKNAEYLQVWNEQKQIYENGKITNWIETIYAVLTADQNFDNYKIGDVVEINEIDKRHSYKLNDNGDDYADPNELQVESFEDIENGININHYYFKIFTEVIDESLTHDVFLVSRPLEIGNGLAGKISKINLFNFQTTDQAVIYEEEYKRIDALFQVDPNTKQNYEWEYNFEGVLSIKKYLKNFDNNGGQAFAYVVFKDLQTNKIVGVIYYNYAHTCFLTLGPIFSGRVKFEVDLDDFTSTVLEIKGEGSQSTISISNLDINTLGNYTLVDKIDELILADGVELYTDDQNNPIGYYYDEIKNITTRVYLNQPKKEIYFLNGIFSGGDDVYKGLIIYKATTDEFSVLGEALWTYDMRKDGTLPDGTKFFKILEFQKDPQKTEWFYTTLTEFWQ